MKNYFILCILALTLTSSLVNAQTPDPFPEGFIGTEEMIIEFFDSFKFYFASRALDCRVDITSPTTKNFFCERQDVTTKFSLRINREIIGDTIKEAVVISVNGKGAGTLQIERTGKNLKPTPDKDLFILKVPPTDSAETYHIVFQGIFTDIRLQKKKDEISSQFTFSARVSLNIRETVISPDEISRRYYFEYPDGHSPVMEIRVKKVTSNIWDPTYRMSTSSRPVSPPNFASYYQGYVGYVYREFPAAVLSSAFLKEMNWPADPPKDPAN